MMEAFMRRLKLVAVAVVRHPRCPVRIHDAGGRAVRPRVRGRSADRGRRTRDRERDAHRRRREDRPGRWGRRRLRTCRRHAREPRRQDRHADGDRHARPSQSHPRRARTGPGLRAYYGVSAVLSLGTDGYELLDMRGQTIPGAARFVSAGRGITMPEPGRTTVPYWITTAAEGRKAVEELATHKWTSSRSGSTRGTASTRS